jgi:hypothetical protein
VPWLSEGRQRILANPTTTLPPISGILKQKVAKEAKVEPLVANCFADFCFFAMVRSMETVATPVTFLSLFTLLPSVQNLLCFATSAAVCFDYASAIDIVSGADAQGWPTNHFTELSSLRCCCCTGARALNNEMEKDKRMGAIAGRACRSATAESGAKLDPDRQKSVTGNRL